MINFVYMDITGSVPFDLAWSVITFFSLLGYAYKAVRGIIQGRAW